MPNLVGLCDPAAEQEELRPRLSRMMDVVDLPGFGFVRRSRVDRGIAVGNLLTGIEDNLAQPARNERCWLMLDGEILNTVSLKAQLRKAGCEPGAADDAELALVAYQTFGEDFTERLNGQWNIVIHHPADGVTLLISDRLGSRTLFFAHDGGQLTFGSEMKGVITGRPIGSRAGGFGLFELLVGAYQLGETTWIDGISVLDPGTVLRFQGGGVETRRYWRFHFNEGRPEMSEDDYIDGFRYRLRIATERCMKRHSSHPIAITLSGGLDSRSIALSIDDRHLPIPALTYGDDDSADVIYARQLANVIGLDFKYVEGNKAGLFEDAARVLEDVLGPSTLDPRGLYSTQIDRMVWSDECLGDMTGTASMVWHPLYAQNMNLMLQGAAGDALTGSHILYDWMKGRTREDVIGDLYRDSYFQTHDDLALVLNPDFLDTHWPRRETYFRRLFKTIDADEPTSVGSVWDMENRQRRGAFSTFGIERYFCTVRAPYLDYDLADHLASLPPLYRFQQRVYKKMIVRCYPQAAHVPWAYTRSPLTDSPMYEFAREWANYWRKRLWRRVFPPPKDQKPAYAFRDVRAILRSDREMSVAVKAWLHSDSFDDSVFNRAGISTLVDDFLAGGGGPDRYILYSYMCALGRAHLWFLSGPIGPVPAEADPARFGVQPAAPRS